MLRDHLALARFISGRTAMPFDWGRNPKTADAHEAGNSCVHFAAGALHAQTGRLIMPQLPGWKTPAGAIAAMGKLGGLEAAADAVLTRIAPAMAQRGDIAGVRDPDTGEIKTLMVVEGDTLVGPDASGARRLRRVQMAVAWSAV